MLVTIRENIIPRTGYSLRLHCRRRVSLLGELAPARECVTVLPCTFRSTRFLCVIATLETSHWASPLRACLLVAGYLIPQCELATLTQVAASTGSATTNVTHSLQGTVRYS